MKQGNKEAGHNVCYAQNLTMSIYEMVQPSKGLTYMRGRSPRRCDLYERLDLYERA